MPVIVSKLDPASAAFAANTQRMGGYALVNLSVAKPLGAGLVLEGRIDNAGDKAYEVARTYANARRAAQATLRWTMP